MTVFMLSLTGIPPLAGFFAKAIVVLGALEVGGAMSWLAVIMMLNAAAAAFYYLRVVVYMYMRKPTEDAGAVGLGRPTQVGLVVAAALTILIGLFPPLTEAVIEWAEAAAVALAQA
jgi:NADH-quinone oxidoreductase subunit N